MRVVPLRWTDGVCSLTSDGLENSFCSGLRGQWPLYLVVTFMKRCSRARSICGHSLETPTSTPAAFPNGFREVIQTNACTQHHQEGANNSQRDCGGRGDLLVAVVALWRGLPRGVVKGQHNGPSQTPCLAAAVTALHLCRQLLPLTTFFLS